MSDKIFSVKKFLGVNEYADSETALEPGQAAAMVNFRITDGGSLAMRPGIRRFTAENFEFFLKRKETIPVYFSGKEYLYCSHDAEGGFFVEFLREGEEVIWKRFDSADPDYIGPVYKSFEHDGKVWLYWLDGTGKPCQDAVPFDKEDKGEPYIPLVLSGGIHSGGGVTVEPLNILSDCFRAKYTAAEGANIFRLPSYTTAVRSVMIGADTFASEDAGQFSYADKTFTLKEAPADGAELEFVCEHSVDEIRSARRRFFDMSYYTHFNGATDSRTFFYGDGSNLCYYTGVPAHGSGLYLPAGNELAVDFSDSPITGMVRHYSRLLVYKPDGVDAVTYEPVTLEDGSVIAGFFLRPVSRDLGNDAIGQVRLVDNAARTLTGSGAYDWRISAGNYRDERYAKRVSDAVAKTFASADTSKIVTCDDGNTKTWYAFLNDADGTVLVHRYGPDVWSIYKSPMFRDVSTAFLYEKTVTFLHSGFLYVLDPAASSDTDDSGEAQSFEAFWESGFQDFGAAYFCKDSSQLWISMLPESGAKLHVSVRTDRRDDYEERAVGPDLSEDLGDRVPAPGTPFVCRLRMKAKRFVWYKLRLTAKSGDRATVLGYEQNIRLSSSVK